MNDKELALKIIELTGSKENISSVRHCATRLRLVVKNKDKINVKAIESLDKVKGYATEDISGFKGLAKRELIRMMDFAKIAQNPYEIDTLIRDIKNAYDIEDEELERESIMGL